VTAPIRRIRVRRYHRAGLLKEDHKEIRGLSASSNKPERGHRHENEVMYPPVPELLPDLGLDVLELTSRRE
jgi:hypothetical protein